MTSLVLVAVERVFAPVLILAEADWPELIRAGGTGAVILLLMYGIKLLVSGVLRLDREVTVEKEGRLAAEGRAQTAEDKLSRLQDAMMHDFSPALLQNSADGKQLVEAGTRLVEIAEKLVDAFLRRISER